MFDLFGNTDVANKIIKDKMMKTFQLNTKLPCSKKNLSTFSPSVLSRYKILFKIERYILSQFNFVVARFSVSKALLLGRRPVSPPLHISHPDELRTFTHDLLPFLHTRGQCREWGQRRQVSSTSPC